MVTYGELLRDCTEREKDIVKGVLGGKKQVYYAKKYGISRSRIRQILVESFHKINKVEKTKKKKVVSYYRGMRNRWGNDMRKWRQAVIDRDGRCMQCGLIEDLEAHHIKPYKDFPDLRFNVNNGEALCHICHKWKHSKSEKVSREVNIT